MTDHLISQRFDDIYFSRQDGLAETEHVFLNSNHLPERFAAQDSFTIAETGFGTGLNFLSAWTLFDRAAKPGAVLDYISFELYPLSAGEISPALAHWSDAFGGRLEWLLRDYPLRTPGWHRVDFCVDGRTRVRLTLVFDDANDALPRMVIPRGVDAWFLDGHAPAKNPQMWTDIVFANMARLSAPGATLATFTAAGAVRDGLRRAGFTVEKTRGYGHKRDMIIGRFAGGEPKHAGKKPNRVAILGGGLAGTACAASLRRRGIDCAIFDPAGALGTGASGNPSGIFNPRFSAHRTAQSDFYSSAYARAARLLRTHPSFHGGGSLHLVTDAEKDKKFRACIENWGWHTDHLRLVEDPSDIAGYKIEKPALFLPDSAQISPRDLCRDWALNTPFIASAYTPEQHGQNFDAIIHANGVAARDSANVPWLPIETVRGQIITARATPASAQVKTNLCYGGYIGTAQNGDHVIGASFQKWLTTTDLRDEDTKDILEKLDSTIPGLSINDVTGARAALRCAARDRFPVIGHVPGQPNAYITTAHGSHGIISALTGADIIADLMDLTPACLPGDSLNALSPQRFLDRIHGTGR